MEREYNYATSPSVGNSLSDQVSGTLSSLGATVASETATSLSAVTTVVAPGDAASSPVAAAFSTGEVLNDHLALALPGAGVAVGTLRTIAPPSPPPPPPPPAPDVQPPLGTVGGDGDGGIGSGANGTGSNTSDGSGGLVGGLAGVDGEGALHDVGTTFALGLIAGGGIVMAGLMLCLLAWLYRKRELNIKIAWTRDGIHGDEEEPQELSTSNARGSVRAPRSRYGFRRSRDAARVGVEPQHTRTAPDGGPEEETPFHHSLSRVQSDVFINGSNAHEQQQGAADHSPLARSDTRAIMELTREPTTGRLLLAPLGEAEPSLPRVADASVADEMGNGARQQSVRSTRGQSRAAMPLPTLSRSSSKVEPDLVPFPASRIPLAPTEAAPPFGGPSPLAERAEHVEPSGGPAHGVLSSLLGEEEIYRDVSSPRRRRSTPPRERLDGQGEAAAVSSSSFTKRTLIRSGSWADRAREEVSWAERLGYEDDDMASTPREAVPTPAARGAGPSQGGGGPSSDGHESVMFAAKMLSRAKKAPSRAAPMLPGAEPPAPRGPTGRTAPPPAPPSAPASEASEASASRPASATKPDAKPAPSGAPTLHSMLGDAAAPSESLKRPKRRSSRELNFAEGESYVLKDSEVEEGFEGGGGLRCEVQALPLMSVEVDGRN